MVGLSQGIPNSNQPVVHPANGTITQPWLQFLTGLQNNASSSTLPNGILLPPGSVDLSAFNKFLTPIGLVNSLPPVLNYTGPAVVFNSADGNLWRFVNGSWTLAVPGSAVIGQVPLGAIPPIPTTQLSGYLQAAQIQANSIGADQISAAYIYAGTVTASQITAGTLSAGVILSSSISAGQISAGTISAALIVGSTISTSSGGSKIVLDGPNNQITASYTGQAAPFFQVSSNGGSGCVVADARYNGNIILGAVYTYAGLATPGYYGDGGSINNNYVYLVGGDFYTGSGNYKTGAGNFQIPYGGTYGITDSSGGKLLSNSGASLSIGNNVSSGIITMGGASVLQVNPEINSTSSGTGAVLGLGSGACWRQLSSFLSVNVISDRTAKRNIKNSDLGLSFIEDLKARVFRYRGDDDSVGRKYGVIAQELEEALAKHGASDFMGLTRPKKKGEKYMVTYEDLICPLIKAVQELSSKIKKLEGV